MDISKSYVCDELRSGIAKLRGWSQDVLFETEEAQKTYNTKAAIDARDILLIKYRQLVNILNDAKEMQWRGKFIKINIKK